MVNELALTLANEKAKDKASLQICKAYCKKLGCESDYYNIIKPIYIKYGWKGLAVGVHWSTAFTIDFIDLDALSTMVYYDDSKHKFVAYDLEN